MPRYAVTLEYLGTAFHGFQKQPGLLTVQGSLEKALLTVTGEEIKVSGAGRTDAGVHAVGQAAAFDLPFEADTEKAMRSITALLPDGAAVTSMREVADGFDPRRNALWREYRYFILNRRAPSPLVGGLSFHFPSGLDLEPMVRACALALGEHDFSAFRTGSEERSTVREVMRCEAERPFRDMVVVTVRANAFLYKMVRILCGALLEVGSGGMNLEGFSSHLEGGVKPCADPLPAHGLFLWEVGY